MQPEPLAELCAEVKKRNLNVIVYTGFTWEQIISEYDRYIDFLKNIDYLIDGKFVEELKSLDLKFKGSRNQRTIDVMESLKKNTVVEFEFD